MHVKNTYIDRIRPRQLFLLDGIGAFLSAASALIISCFEPYFGIPATTLYTLAGITCIFCTYSLLNYLRNPGDWRLPLRVIAVANLSYCAVTAGLIIYLYPGIQLLGILFFAFEILIVCLIAFWELKTSRR